MSKKYRINSTLNVGSPDAETDELLFDVFVRNETLSQILDTSSQKSILLGRTGSGKSAVIQFIERNKSDVQRIDPEALSLQFLSNSTILKYFKELDVNLNLFFKVLWKHVFIVELLKMYFKEDYNKFQKDRWLTELRQSWQRKFGKLDPIKEQALKYLDTWTDKFWHDTEYRVKELERTIGENFKQSLGIKADIFNAVGDIQHELREKSIAEVKHKAESVIHEVQTKELLNIFNIMRDELFTSHQKKFYIVIDDLDKNWIESTFRYDLIDAMAEVVKEFQRFKGVKIVISLRENLNELLRLGSRHEGGQREKIKPLYANMKWSKEALSELIDSRLKAISENRLTINDSFYFVRRTNETGFEYVLRRTYMRPRDVISFVNHAIDNASSKTSFTKDVIHKAETPYSEERFEALEDEWRENYGEIYPICKFLNGIQNGFRLKSLNENHFEEILLEENLEKRFKGSILEAAVKWREEKIKTTVFIKRVVYLLYHIGVIGIKKGPTFPTAFFYDDLRITRDDVSNNNTFYVHPSLFSYFKVNTMEQLPENLL